MKLDKKELKGIMVNLFHMAQNENISNQESRFLLVGDGVPEVTNGESLDDNQILLAKIHENEVIAIPYFRQQSWNVFSGCFVYCMDSRYTKCFNGQPLKLYRKES